MKNIYQAYSFNEIKESPRYFISELVSESENSFLLFQYGPYLTMNYTNTFVKSLPIIKNDILILMTNVANLINITNSNLSIGEIKLKIKDIIQTSGRYKYGNKINEIGTALMDTIRNKQYEDKILESAMLNYSPIVTYSKTIVKSEMEKTNPRYNYIEILNIDFSELDSLIEQYIVDDIVPILMENDKFINCDKIKVLGSNAVPRELINPQVNNILVSMYFTCVYLKYVVKEEKYSDYMENLFKINTLYNKIHNGEKIDIHSAVESFSNIISPENMDLRS